MLFVTVGCTGCVAVTDTNTLYYDQSDYVAITKGTFKCYVTQLLTLRRGGLVSNFPGKKVYVTLEWPLMKPLLICSRLGYRSHSVGKLIA